MDKYTFTAMIYEARIKRRITCKDAARDLGISFQSLMRYENGDELPNVQKLVRMTEYYDLDRAKMFEAVAMSAARCRLEKGMARTADERVRWNEQEADELRGRPAGRLTKMLIDLRFEKGVSQREAGQMSGVPSVNISKYESGLHKPSIQTLRLLAEYYGVEFSVLAQAYQDEYGVKPTDNRYWRSECNG